MGGLLVYDVCTSGRDSYTEEPLPSRLDNLDGFDLMRRRRSCRGYQRRPLQDRDREELLERIQEVTRPESLIGNQRIRIEFVQHPLYALLVTGASEFFVAIVPKDFNRLCIVDVGYALEKVILHATRMGLGTCWVGGFVSANVVSHLGGRFDAQTDHVAVICAVGYRTKYMPLIAILMEQTVLNRRQSLSDLFFNESFGVPLNIGGRGGDDDKKEEEYSEDREEEVSATFGRTFETTQWSPSARNAQTTRVVRVSDGSKFRFYATSGSRFYAPLNLGIWLAQWQLGVETAGMRGGRFFVEDGAEDSVPSEKGRYAVTWEISEEEREEEEDTEQVVVSVEDITEVVT